MSKAKHHRDQFDRFAQDNYLQALLQTEPDAIIPTLFLDLMNRVNLIEGQADLILAEVERARAAGEPTNTQDIVNSSVNVLGGAVDASNILKALMEYHEVTQQADEDKPEDT